MNSIVTKLSLPIMLTFFPKLSHFLNFVAFQFEVLRHVLKVTFLLSARSVRFLRKLQLHSLNSLTYLKY